MNLKRFKIIVIFSYCNPKVNGCLFHNCFILRLNFIVILWFVRSQLKQVRKWMTVFGLQDNPWKLINIYIELCALDFGRHMILEIEDNKYIGNRRLMKT